MAHSFHNRCAAAVIRRRLLLVTLTSLIIVAACVWYWLLHTESGARWIWARAQIATNGALQAQQFEGNFGSGLTVRRFTFSSDGTVIAVEEVRLVADLDLLPLQLQLSEVVLDDTKIEVSTQEKESQSKDLKSLLENLSLPLALVFTDISANRITVSGLGTENEIQLLRASLAGSWHDEIVIRQLLVDSHNSSINIDASLALSRPFAATVGAQATNVFLATWLPEPVDITLHGDGDLEEISIELMSSPVAVSVQGSLADVLDTLSWNLQAELSEANLVFGSNETEVDVIDALVTSNGMISEYMLSAAATVDAPGFEPFQLTTSGVGTETGLQFSKLSLRNDDADLSGNGRIAWGENWLIESQVNVAVFNLNSLVTEWPVTHPVRGNLSLQLNKDQLAIKKSQLTAGDTDMSVGMDGKIDLRESVVVGNLHWENARWPLPGDEPTVASKSGTFVVNGSLDEWRVDGNVDVTTSAMPLGRLRVDGNGDRHHVEATIIDGAVLGGNVAGSVNFNWRDQQQWTASLDMSDIDFDTIAPDWPGSVSGSVDADGHLRPFLLNLQLSTVDGEYLGVPLSADGKVTLTDDHFAASDLSIKHGDTLIELNGDPYARSGLEFDVAVGDASRYVDDANGEFVAAGMVSLNRERPSLRVSASSDAFSFGNVAVAGIEIIDRSDDDGIVNTEIKAEQLAIQDNVIDEVTVSLLADSSSQSLQLDASYRDADFHLLAAGKFDDLQHPDRWLGELRALNLVLEDEPLAGLSDPVPLSLSQNTATLGQGCVAAPTGMRLCAAADWSAGDYFEVSADLSDVPVDLVNRFINTGLKFDQQLNGNFDWSQSTESGTKGDANISISPGSVIDIDYPDVAITTEAGLVSFEVLDSQLLSGSAELTMPGFGHIDTQISISDFAQGTDSHVDGTLDLDLSDMTVLAAFSPVIDAASGEFRADLVLSGTLSEPLLVGDLAVTDGSITYMPIGLRLEEINLSSLLHDNGQFELKGEFQAGEGRGEIVTRADYAMTGAKGFELELRGNNMTLVDVPNVTAHADLDIELGYDYEKLSLAGQILIPHARVKPTNLAVSREVESEDVVIVAGELPDDFARRSSEQDAWIEGSLAVEFGNDVSIDLGPATAELTGRTVFSWGDELIPDADGRYDLTGSIQAFGQTLEITEGGFRFPKIPADNPFIRIRAEREIYGNAQVKTAGVLVDGTLRQPSISAYTRPLTTEERALTLLVTGSDFDFEQGVGAIDFGTYIAPRIFVSYGLGLFETENVIRVRYDLKRGFGITATSGEKETGLDLSYRIER